MLPFLLLCPVLVAALPAEDGSDSIDALLQRGVELLHGMRYQEAQEHFKLVTQRAPEDPRGYFFQSQVAYWQLLLDPADEKRGERFQELSEETIKVAKRRLRRSRDAAQDLLYLGRAYGNLGRYHAITGEYLKAYWASKKAKKILKDLVAEHPGCIDAELELGLYHYYADLAPKILKAFSFLLGIEGDREAGLAKLVRVAERGELTRTDAAFYLQDIYQRYEERYEEAGRLNRELLQQYPDNLLFLNTLADSMRRSGRAGKALPLYQRVVEQDRAPGLGRAARYDIARCHLDRNELEPAVAVLTAAIASLQAEGGTDHWSYGWSYYLLGYCYDLLGNRTQALANYRLVPKSNDNAFAAAREAIRNPLTRADADMAFINNRIDQHEDDEAMALIRQTLARLGGDDPEYPLAVEPELTYLLARCHIERKEHEQAVSELRQVLASPHEPAEWLHPWTHYRLAQCYLALGKEQLAEQHLEHAAEYKKDQLLRLKVARARRE